MIGEPFGAFELVAVTVLPFPRVKTAVAATEGGSSKLIVVFWPLCVTATPWPSDVTGPVSPMSMISCAVDKFSMSAPGVEIPSELVPSSTLPAVFSPVSPSD